MEVLAAGDSMRPTIAPGERLRIAPIDAEDLRVGDVVALLASDGTLFAHRLVRLEHGCLVTRGDLADSADEPHAIACLVGRVGQGGAIGRAIVRWPRLALILGAASRINRLSDAPGAATALAMALAVRAARRTLAIRGAASTGG